MPDIYRNYTKEEILSFTKEAILSFLQEGNRGRRISEEELSNLIARINELAAGRQFYLWQAGDVLNEISKLNCDDYLLKSRLDIGNLTKELVQQTAGETQRQGLERLNQVSSFDLINLIKGCANLAYDKAELPWNMAVLAKWIDVNIGNISHKGALSLLHSFAKFGYDSDDRVFLRTLKKIADKAKSGIGIFSVKDIVDLSHGLAKAKLFDDLFEIAPPVKEEMRDHYSSMEHETAHAMLQVDLFSRCFKRQDFFGEQEVETVETLRSRCPEKIIYLSQFHRHVEQQLIGMGWEILERESPLDWVRRADIKCRKGNIILIVEVDGPSHYLLGRRLINSDTKRRDEINEFLIESIARESEERDVRYLYLKVPFYVTDLQELVTNLVANSQEEVKAALVVEEVNRPAETIIVDIAIPATQIVSSTAQEKVTAMEAEAKSGKKSGKKKGGAKAEEKKSGNQNSKKKGKKAAQEEEDLDALLKEFSFQDQQILSPEALANAINKREVRTVNNILEMGAVDVNTNAPQSNSSFLNYALTCLLSSRPTQEEALLTIINALIAAGAVHTESEKIVDSRKGLELFEKAIRGELYNAASLIFSIYEDIVIPTKTLNKIIAKGPAELIAQTVYHVQDKNNFWETILERRDAEAIIERLSMIKTSPTDLLIAPELLPDDYILELEFLHLGVGRRNEAIVSAFAKPELAISRDHPLDEFSPLQLAVFYGYGNIIDILIERVGEENLTFGMIQSLLQIACNRGHEALVTRFVKDESNLLTEAISVSNGVDIRTPIHSAAECGYVEVIKVLLELAKQYKEKADADIRIKNYVDVKSQGGGLTPLYMAVSFAKEEVVRYLISMKADINAKTTDECEASPIHVAAAKGYLNIVSVLVENNAEIDAVTQKGRTPLDIAVEASYLEICQFLISKGASLTAGNFNLLDIAEEQRDNAIATGDQEEIARAENVYQLIAQALSAQQEETKSTTPITSEVKLAAAQSLISTSVSVCNGAGQAL